MSVCLSIYRYPWIMVVPYDHTYTDIILGQVFIWLYNIKFLPEIQTPFQIHIHILEYLHH